MSKRKKIIICAISITIAVLIIASIVWLKAVCPIKHYANFCPIKIYSPNANISRDECSEQNGRIVNTFGADNCTPSEINIGNVKGMNCPCVCCVEKEQGKAITKEQAKQLIAQNYPELIQARGDANIPEDRIKQTDNGWQIDVFWGLCLKCHCVFEVKNDGAITALDKGEAPQFCNKIILPAPVY